MKLIYLGTVIGLLAMASVNLPSGPSVSSKPLTVQEQRWKTAQVRTSKQSEVRWVARKIERSKSRYQDIEKDTGVAWWAIACLHNMECGLRFDQHLHNGDSLTARTWQVPKGRPKTGNPPFSFEFSAKDALLYDKMDKVNWKDLNSSLNAFEEYNGVGYRKYHPNVPTPYLWSGTTIYTSGKYVQDGKWSSTAVSSQIGIVPILKELNVDW
jgi:lysozyme family protein